MLWICFVRLLKKLTLRINWRFSLFDKKIKKIIIKRNLQNIWMCKIKNSFI